MKKHVIISILLMCISFAFYAQKTELNIIINKKSDIYRAKDFTSIDFYLKDINSNQINSLVKEVASYSGIEVFTMKEMGQNLDLYKGYIKFSGNIDFKGLEKILNSYNITYYTVGGEKKEFKNLYKETAEGKIKE